MNDWVVEVKDFEEEILEGLYTLLNENGINKVKDLINLKNKQIQELTNNWNELEEFIDAEKTRLAKECSHTYEDSLGKTRYVNEDIFNELNNILDKMKEIKEK